MNDYLGFTLPAIALGEFQLNNSLNKYTPWRLARQTPSKSQILGAVSFLRSLQT